MVRRATEIHIPPVPVFNLRANGTKDWKYLRSLASYLELVHQGAEQFIAAISLFQFANINQDDEKVSPGWRNIAARAGAISLNDMYIGIRLACQLSSNVTGFGEIADIDGLLRAQKYFSESFPNAEKIRHVVVHQEFYNSTRTAGGEPNKYIDEQLYFSANTNLESCISGERWISTWEGETVGYNITDESAEMAFNTCIILHGSFKDIL